MRVLKNIVLVTFPTVVVLLVVLEAFFRVVIPASDPPRGYFDENHKLYCLADNQRQGVYTIGRFADIRAKWRINDAHWNYPIDYDTRNVEKPLIAVIGDSFVEALQVDVDKNYPFLLRNRLNGDYEVFAFGVSGAPLSQYLHVSRYVNERFDPDILVFNVVHNDFAHSISSLSPRYHYFLQVSIDDDGNVVETTPRPNYSFAQYKSWKRFCYRSALFRYLYFNLKVKEIGRNLRGDEDRRYEANIDTENTNRHREQIEKATRYVVNAIRRENEDKRVVFVINAPRNIVYEGAGGESEVMWIHDMLDTLCSRNEIELLDLTPFMVADYRVNGKRFDSEVDAHWNEYGHRFVADVLYEQLMGEKL